jgi:cation/acetate symporter
MQSDMVVLAAPEIAGLPYVISGLVAAGALAAALSTADGLLLTIANALSHDFYYSMVDSSASTQRRVTLSKILLLGVALLASYVASLNTGNILFLVGAAFSLAASSFFPVLVLGVFWKRTTKRGAVAGIVAGLAVCIYYIVSTHPYFAQLTGLTGVRWFGIQPISSGVFGVPAGFIATIGVSLFDRKPDADTLALVDYIRHP